MRHIRTTVAAVFCLALIGVSQQAIAQQGGRGAVDAKKPDPLASRPTPMTPDGHPDLSGIWGGQSGNGAHTGDPNDPNGSKTVTLRPRLTKPLSEDPDQKQAFLSTGGALAPVYKLGDDGKVTRIKDWPLPPITAPYKPELLPKVKELQYNGYLHDPAFGCGNPGVPRLGPPTHVYQNNGYVLLVYVGTDYDGNPLGILIAREIPTDGRKHDMLDEDTYTGDSVGHWEGNTLVIDSISFNDETWFGGNGYFHSDQMHVVERLTRQGDTLTWSATVEDPVVLTAPYSVPPRTVHLNPAGNSGPIIEVPPCVERDMVHLKGYEDK